MIRRPPRSTLSSSSAASDVYKRQVGPADFPQRDFWTIFGKAPRSAVAQGYLRNGDVTILKRHIAPRRLERSRSLCGLEIDRVSGQHHAVEVSTAEKFD